MSSNLYVKYRPVILITGCSSGLGKALAEMFYDMEEYRVVITARTSSLPELNRQFRQSDRFLIRAMDITNEAQQKNVVTEIQEKWQGVDVLINNAGISYRSVIEHMDDHSEFHQLMTNYLGPMSLIRQVLPAMRGKGRGKIINISSVSGMVSMPTMASYSASKHALEGSSEALWYEVRPFGINVSLVQPGFVRSQSFEKVYFSKRARISHTIEGPYSDYYQFMSPFIRRLMNFSRSTPEKIAQKILKVIKTPNPPLWVPVTPDAAVFALLRKMLPRAIFHKLMMRFLPGTRVWAQSHSNADKKRLSA